MGASALLLAYEDINRSGGMWPFGIDRSWNYRAFRAELLRQQDRNDTFSSFEFSSTGGAAEAYLFEHDDRELSGRYRFAVARPGAPVVDDDLRDSAFNDRVSGVLLVNRKNDLLERRVSLTRQFGPDIEATVKKALAGPGGIGGGGGPFTPSARIGTPRISWVGCPSWDMDSGTYLTFLDSETYARVRFPITVTISLVLGFTDDYACSVDLYLRAGRTADDDLKISILDHRINVESGAFAGEVREGLRQRLAGKVPSFQDRIDGLVRQQWSQVPSSVKLDAAYFLPGDRTDMTASRGSGDCGSDATLVVRVTPR